YLDPDGAEPSDGKAARARSFSVGRERDGTVPVRGDLLPEIAGQLQLLLDAILNPRVDGPVDPTNGVHFTDSADAHSSDPEGGETTPNGDPISETQFFDHRTRAQKLHDAFAMIINTAASADQLPH